jgi:hypothetical protein
MPGPLFDCYVLAPERTADWAERFLDEFLPERTPSFEESDPSEVLGLPKGITITELFRFLEEHPQTDYRMYWQHTACIEPYHAHLAFNPDGSLVLGLSPYTDDHLDKARHYLRRMEAFAGTGPGLLFCEEPAPGTREDFRNAIGE